MPEAPQDIWAVIRQEVQEEADREPLLSRFLHETILKHNSLVDALGFHLSHKLSNSILSPAMLQEIMEEAFRNLPIMECVVSMDIRAIHDRDPACRHYYEPLLFYKGFHSLESYRVAHWLWTQNRKSLAYFLQNRISEVFAVDIHPAARIGTGILIDHATSIVIGETAVVEDNVSLLHDVTLGGTGKEQGDRHPKVRHGVLIGAGAKILGNVEIGEGAKIGAGSVVLMNIPPHCTAVGVPAVIVGKAEVAEPALAMDHSLKDVPPCPKNSQCLLRS